FIQTPGWDGKSRIDFLMDSCVQITAPPGGRIIVSFVGFYYEVALGIGSCKYNSVSRRRYGHLWNCTVPNWADFQQHFPCNLHDNCLNGRMRPTVRTSPTLRKRDASVGDTNVTLFSDG
ncbi:hypothetical protein BaRGS_00038609, partial [Batillaria attramentaria]